MSLQMTQAQPEDAAVVAALVGELQFDRTLAFYQREGFSISGGRKLKRELP